MAAPVVRLRALWRLARMVLHVVHGVFIVAVGWSRRDEASRHARVAWWAGKLLHVLGVQRVVHGSFRPGATLLLANHVSWLDIVAIHAVCPRARFVSKAEVGHWPLVGMLTRAAGTLFIERERRRDAMRVVHQAAEALQAGDMVAVFPEGTTGDGHGVMPFHANLLQAAIASGVPVQPVVLRFAEPGLAVSPAAAWVGETTLLQSLWAIASAASMVVHLSVLAPQASRHADRRALAASVREMIADELARQQGA